MRRTLSIIATAALVLVLYFIVVMVFHPIALRKAARVGVLRGTQRAYDHFCSTGNLTNPVPTVAEVFTFTNQVRIGDRKYNCVFAMEWHHYGISTGTVIAVTKNGDFLLLVPGKNPKLMKKGAGDLPKSSS